jgi:hypothetical protein
MAQTDTRGLPISTASDTAAARYREGIDLMLSAWPGAMEALQAALEADADFALAHVAIARIKAMRAEPAAARASIATATALAQRQATPRETSHIAAISFAVHGQTDKALASALTHLEQWPRDVLILMMPLGAFGLFAFSGMAGHDQARVDLCERVADHYDADDWCFLTYRGWSHTENGRPDHGRALTAQGFALKRANANAAHALSHAMFEQGAGEEAATLIDAWLPSYHRTGILHGHIAWHAALSALERDDPAGALSIYERFVRPEVSHGVPINVMTDAVSFLWRLKAYGHDVPAQAWREAKTIGDARFPKAGHAFIDAHMGLLAAATGDAEAAAVRIEAATKLVEAGTLTAGPVVPTICRAALAFANGEYAACANLLEPMRHEVVRIGGSGAQREMIEDTLLLAFMRSGETRKAHALLDQRLHRRPSARDVRWRSMLAA